MWCFNDMESMRKLEEWGFNGNLDFGIKVCDYNNYESINKRAKYGFNGYLGSWNINVRFY